MHARTVPSLVSALAVLSCKFLWVWLWGRKGYFCLKASEQLQSWRPTSVGWKTRWVYIFLPWKGGVVCESALGRNQGLPGCHTLAVLLTMWSKMVVHHVPNPAPEKGKGYSGTCLTFYWPERRHMKGRLENVALCLSIYMPCWKLEGFLTLKDKRSEDIEWVLLFLFAFTALSNLFTMRKFDFIIALPSVKCRWKMKWHFIKIDVA